MDQDGFIATRMNQTGNRSRKITELEEGRFCGDSGLPLKHRGDWPIGDAQNVSFPITVELLRNGGSLPVEAETRGGLPLIGPVPFFSASGWRTHHLLWSKTLER
jgi:hypothetical protein